MRTRPTVRPGPRPLVPVHCEERVLVEEPRQPPIVEAESRAEAMHAEAEEEATREQAVAALAKLEAEAKAKAEAEAQANARAQAEAVAQAQAKSAAQSVLAQVESEAVARAVQLAREEAEAKAAVSEVPAAKQLEPISHSALGSEMARIFDTATTELLEPPPPVSPELVGRDVTERVELARHALRVEQSVQPPQSPLLVPQQCELALALAPPSAAPTPTRDRDLAEAAALGYAAVGALRGAALMPDARLLGPLRRLLVAFEAAGAHGEARRLSVATCDAASHRWGANSLKAAAAACEAGLLHRRVSALARSAPKAAGTAAEAEALLRGCLLIQRERRARIEADGGTAEAHARDRRVVGSTHTEQVRPPHTRTARPIAPATTDATPCFVLRRRWRFCRTCSWREGSGRRRAISFGSSSSCRRPKEPTPPRCCGLCGSCATRPGGRTRLMNCGRRPN